MLEIFYNVIHVTLTMVNQLLLYSPLFCIFLTHRTFSRPLFIYILRIRLTILFFNPLCKIIIERRVNAKWSLLPPAEILVNIFSFFQIPLKIYYYAHKLIKHGTIYYYIILHMAYSKI